MENINQYEVYIHLQQVSQSEVLVPDDGLADDLFYLFPVAMFQWGVSQTGDTRHDKLEICHFLLQPGHHLIVR